MAERTQGEVAAMDGKALRGSRTTDVRSIVHMVSAWAGPNNLVPGQRKDNVQSNHIKTIPEVL